MDRAPSPQPEHESITRVRDKLLATKKTQMEIADGTKALTGTTVAQTTISRLFLKKSPNMRVRTLGALEEYADSVLSERAASEAQKTQGQQPAHA